MYAHGCRPLQSCFKADVGVVEIQYFIGIDIGSTATKAVALTPAGTILGSKVVSSGAGTHADEEALHLLRQECHLLPENCGCLVATGYGRLICREADMQMSEISCHAKGIHHLLPETRTIIDIGGQDLKVIRINERGSVQQFMMNDKCAAGTGRFLEVMSQVLKIPLSELGTLDQKSVHIEPVSSTCTVFAESEVISKLASGAEIPNIIAGIHDSVARKVVGLAMRIGVEPQVALTGGVALNQGVIRALERNLKQHIMTADISQLTGALGAALIGLEKKNNFE